MQHINIPSNYFGQHCCLDCLFLHLSVHLNIYLLHQVHTFLLKLAFNFISTWFVMFIFLRTYSPHLSDVFYYFIALLRIKYI